MSFLMLCVSLVLLCSVPVRGARILGVFNIPSLSHQVVYQSVWRELSLRGHDVTVMSPHPLNDPVLTNLTEIDLGFLYNSLGDLKKQMALVMDHWDWITNLAKYNQITTNELFSDRKVQEFIRDTTKKFDIVLVEAVLPSPAAFSYKFKCPLILVSSLSIASPFHELAGTPGHPVLYPDLSTTFQSDPTFFQRVEAVLFYWYHRYLTFHVTLPDMNRVIKRYFGEDTPNLKEILKNTSMILLNTNPLIHKPRPFGPNVIEMGGRMHFKPKKPLPLVIYLSLPYNCVIAVFL